MFGLSSSEFLLFGEGFMLEKANLITLDEMITITYHINDEKLG